MELFKSFMQSSAYFGVALIVAYAWYSVLYIFSAERSLIGSIIMLVPLEIVFFYLLSFLSPIVLVWSISKIFSDTTETEVGIGKILATLASIVFMFQVYGFFTFGYVEATKIITVILVATFQYVWLQFYKMDSTHLH